MGLFKSNIQKTIKKLKEDQLNKIEPLKLSFNVLIQRLNNERRKLKDLEELIKLQESSKDIAQKRGKDILAEEYEKQIENTLEKCNKQEALIVQLQPVINNCKKIIEALEENFQAKLFDLEVLANMQYASDLTDGISSIEGSKHSFKNNKILVNKIKRKLEAESERLIAKFDVEQDINL